MDDFISLVTQAEAREQRYAIAIVVRTEGSTSGKAGAKTVILEDGSVLGGWVGGGCVESAVIQAALQAIRTGIPATIDLDLTDEFTGLGMPCGGKMTVYIEPKVPPRTLVILGNNSLSKALARLGTAAGWKILIDDSSATHRDYPPNVTLITDDLEYTRFPVHPNTFVVVATHHKGDHRPIAYAIREGATYVALVASRKRARIVLDMVREMGIPEEALSVVRTPAGLDIGAKSPEEIAISILAEIVYEARKPEASMMAQSDSCNDAPRRFPARESRNAGSTGPKPQNAPSPREIREG
ncbi:MAG: XdhC family protein [bacterium JZ-2024 1]